MRKKPALACSLVLALLVASGCGPKQESRSQRSGAAAVDTSTRQIRPVISIDQSGLRKLVSQRNGKILFLNIWATWCAPCVEEYPDLVKLAGSYSEQEVEVVGISADYPDEVDSKITPFLRKLNVPFTVYVANFQHQEDFINAVDPSWNGALPATLIFDKRGNRRSFLVGQGSYDRFRKMVDSARTGP
jgi:thiol-disulfide isomerase/thioredoxin